jgi:catechol 2,3-dioxygenase-like lactoylglutathione lyase family enzyme
MAAELSLLVLRCADIDAARRFYEALGLLWREERHEGGPRHYSCRLGATLFELYPAKDGATGRVRLGIATADPDRAAEAAIAAGGRRRDARPGAGIIVQDPDGNDVELLGSSGPAAVGASAVLSHATAHELVRTYSSRPGDPPPFDVNAVIHLMLAALDNLRAHWIDADLEQIALSATQEQRQHLIRIGEFLRDHPEAGDDDDR